MALLDGLHPDLFTKLTAVLVEMATLGHPMRVCQGVRTAEYQHDLWLQGRVPSHPGPIVTQCDGFLKKSNHQSGRAVDCCFEGNDPFGEHQPWAAYGKAAKAQGLQWGGDFTHPDRPHIELVGTRGA